MFDIQTNTKIVNQLEALLLKARSGKLAAVALVTIDTEGKGGDAICELQPQPLLIPAVIGSLHMLAIDLQIAQRTQVRKSANG